MSNGEPESQVEQEGQQSVIEPTADQVLGPAPYTEEDPRKYDAGKGLLEAAKEFLFVADEAGDPVVSVSEPGVVHMLWPDGSMVTARFEARKGELGMVSAHPASESERKARNEAFSKRKKARDEELERIKQAREAQAKEPAQV
jgi:hypothetical protein